MAAPVLLGLALTFEGAVALKVGPRATLPTALESIDFDTYTRLHDRSYPLGSDEYLRRRELFHKRVAEVAEQNSQPDRMWTATINHLTDRTDEELEKLRGYNRAARPSGPQVEAKGGVQLLSTASRALRLEDLPAQFSWGNLQAANKIMDQKACGSCWALSAASVIRAHSEIYTGQDQSCSVEQVISCTPNPGHCGGTGGCEGATTELAMEYILQNGCQNSSQWPYDARTQDCPVNSAAQQGEIWGRLGDLLHREEQRSTTANIGSARWGMLGYRKLPENRVAPLLLALYEQGPVAVTVGAGSAWNMYHSGVMSSCRKNVVISHAVVLLGYGESQGRRNKVHQYWLLQNSWGKRWGENGLIRLQRHSHEEEEAWCGWDANPGAGSGCAGGPRRVWVCGSCGILYDNVVPIFPHHDPSVLVRARALQEQPPFLTREQVGPQEVR